MSLQWTRTSAERFRDLLPPSGASPSTWAPRHAQAAGARRLPRPAGRSRSAVRATRASSPPAGRRTRFVDSYGPTEATVGVNYPGVRREAWTAPRPSGAPCPATAPTSWTRRCARSRSARSASCTSADPASAGSPGPPRHERGSFVPDPFAGTPASGSTAGDLARWTADGELVSPDGPTARSRPAASGETEESSRPPQAPGGRRRRGRGGRRWATATPSDRLHRLHHRAVARRDRAARDRRRRRRPRWSERVRARPGDPAHPGRQGRPRRAGRPPGLRAAAPQTATAGPARTHRPAATRRASGDEASGH